MINLAAYIYIVEFDDVDGTRFRKFGIGRIGTTVDRLETHISLGARVIDVQKETLLTCVVAEQGIKVNVGEVAYLPLIEMKSGGRTECYAVNREIDLKAWLLWARRELDLGGEPESEHQSVARQSHAATRARPLHGLSVPAGGR